MSEKFLITHDGTFHADEVFASAVLTALFPDATLIRSRAKEVLEMEGDKIIYDVGGVYDPEHGRFDHHQSGAPSREDGGTMSSFGQIWKHYGHQYLEQLGVRCENIPAVHANIWTRVAKSIDMSDNGEIAPANFGPMAGVSVLSMICDMNLPASAKRYMQDRAFDTAVSLAGNFLSGRALQLEMKIELRKNVRFAVDACDGSILHLPEGAPFNSVIREAGSEHIKFVVYPDGDKWILNGVTPESGSYDLRLALPESWAGLAGQDLARETGVADAVFCHRGLFLAVASSRDGVMALADIALENEKNLNPGPVLSA